MGYIKKLLAECKSRLLTIRIKKPHRIRIGVIEFRSGMVCVHSLFDGGTARTYKLRRVWAMAAAALAAVSTLSVTLVNSMLCLAVYVNGEEVGTARSISDMTRIVSNAEEHLAEILGYEYSLSDSLTFTANIAVSNTKPEEIEKAILSSVDGVSEKYTLVIGGETVGAADDEDAIYGLLESILVEYSTPASASVRFLGQVLVTRQFVSEEISSDLEQIRELIDPANTESPYALTVECVENTLRSEEIPFETEYVEDDTKYTTDTIVVNEGKPGIVQFTETTVLINGMEQSRTRIAEMQVSSPVNEVVAVGTAERPRTASYGYYIWPAEGTLTSKFGYRRVAVGSSNHKGIDIAGSYGQAIYAADGGEVITAEWNSSFGYMVKILHDNGEVTLYAHNSELLVSKGQRVAQGDQIAKMGSTGVSSGVHCHFELIVNGTQIDPLGQLTVDS